MKTAPGQGRDCQQNQRGQRHYQAQATQRNRSDHNQLNRRKHGKPQRPQWSGMDLFSLRNVRMPGQFGATLRDQSDNHHCNRSHKENDECRHPGEAESRVCFPAQVVRERQRNVPPLDK
jgi:hypothetical protein